MEYRWLEAGVPLGGWSPSTSTSVTPGTTTTYELEVRCLGTPECVASDSVTVEVYAYPEVEAGGDVILCLGDSVRLELPDGATELEVLEIEYV